MIKVVTSNKNVEFRNDLFFDYGTKLEVITEDDKKVMRAIDKAEFKSKNAIITPFGNTSIERLSTGCKTLMNILHHREIIFTLIECGQNVIDYLLSGAIDNVTVHYYGYLYANELEVPIEIDGNEISNIKELRRWCSEYDKTQRN